MKIIEKACIALNDNPPSILQLDQKFNEMETDLQNYHSMFKKNRNIYGLDVFDLSEKRNIAWKDIIQPYLDQNKKVAVFVGSFHIFAHLTITLSKLFNAKYGEYGLIKNRLFHKSLFRRI